VLRLDCAEALGSACRLRCSGAARPRRTSGRRCACKIEQGPVNPCRTPCSGATPSISSCAGSPPHSLCVLTSAQGE